MSWSSSQEVIGPTAVFLVICFLSGLFARLLFPPPPASEKEIELRWRQHAA